MDKAIHMKELLSSCRHRLIAICVLSLAVPIGCREPTGLDGAPKAISPSAATIEIGQSIQLAALSSSGDTIAPSLVTWNSATPTIASVSPNGIVTGLTSGAIEITASAEQATAKTTISVNGAVQSSGGTVRGMGGVVVLAFPAGAVPDSTTVSVREATKSVQERMNLDALAVPGTAYDFSSTSPRFSRPVELRIAFDPDRLPLGVDPKSVRLFRLDGDTTVLVETSGLESGSVVNANIATLSTYVLRATDELAPIRWTRE